MKTTIHTCIGLIAVLFFHAAGTASAALIASDSFDYSPVPVALNGLGGASNGWAGSWYGASGTNNVIAGSLDSPVATGESGNQAIIGGGTTSLIFRQLDSNINTGTAYVGFIFQRNTTSDRTGGLSFGPNGAEVFVGVSSVVPGAELVLSTGTQPGDTVSTGITATQNTPFQIVLKVDFAGEQIDMFVNQSTEGTADATRSSYDFASIGTGTGIDIFRLFAGGTASPLAAQSANFDEIRIASSYADAVAVVIPEPGTLAMLVLAGIGLLITRRRRS